MRIHFNSRQVDSIGIATWQTGENIGWNPTDSYAITDSYRYSRIWSKPCL